MTRFATLTTLIPFKRTALGGFNGIGAIQIVAPLLPGDGPFGGLGQTEVPRQPGSIERSSGRDIATALCDDVPFGTDATGQLLHRLPVFTVHVVEQHVLTTE